MPKQKRRGCVGGSGRVVRERGWCVVGRAATIGSVLNQSVWKAQGLCDSDQESPIDVIVVGVVSVMPWSSTSSSSSSVVVVVFYRIKHRPPPPPEPSFWTRTLLTVRDWLFLSKPWSKCNTAR